MTMVRENRPTTIVPVVSLRVVVLPVQLMGIEPAAEFVPLFLSLFLVIPATIADRKLKKSN